MIRQYRIHNFKNHADTSLDLGGLTILTGINGVGKSSVFQSMLILRESFLRRPSMKVLSLDGASFSIGSSAGLVNRNVNEKENLLQLGLLTEDGNYEFSFRYPVGDKNEMEAAEDILAGDTDPLLHISLFNNYFQYLSAFRMGPQQIYQSHTGVVDKHRQISDRLGMGEYVAYFLSLYGNEKIPVEALAYPGSEAMSLNQQTELWMGEISEGIKIQIHQNGGQYDLNYGYEIPGRTTTYHSALNTGFSISYVLSVVVAVLSARPGSLLLIENPEAHLHPAFY